MSTTETISPLYAGLDSWDDTAILDAFLEGQERAVAAVKAARPALARAAQAIVGRLGEDSRIVFVGAGSSGIIAALDGMELTGTFGWPEERVVFVLASGERIAPLTGGGEDDAGLGRSRIAAIDIKPADVVIAVAASGSTPFTVAAVSAAAEKGALTIGLANNAEAPLFSLVDVPIFLDSGPEVIVGSTRMGAGTAQKIALGLISSLAMIRLGHVFDGLMVNLTVDNAKLRRRAIRMLVHLTGCEDDAAAAALDSCDGEVKAAVLVARGVAPGEARDRLSAAGGNLRSALAGLT